MLNYRFVLLGLVSLSLARGSAQAAFVAPNLPGATQFDGWYDLSAAANPGYPGYPGTKAWPAPIGSAAAGSGDATLNKTGNGAGGGPYPSSTYIYHGGTSSTPNTLGGSLAVSDATPVAGLETVVFQIKISEAYGYDLYNNAAPVLSYNGGAQSLVPTITQLVSAEQIGVFDPGTGPEPIYTNEWLFQWDLSSLGSITDFTVGWSSVQHSLIYAVQLDQGNTFVPVPEPSTLVLAGLAGVALVVARRRRAG